MYLLNGNLIVSMSVGLLFFIVFIIVFHDEFYILRHLFSFSLRNRAEINPFGDLVFWYNKKDHATLCISNRKDMIHLAIRIFQIDVIPENVHSAIHLFVRALSSKDTQLSYSYQIVQKPIIPLFQKDSSREITLSSMQSRVASIYFTVFYDIKGILTTHKLDQLHYFIKNHSKTIKSNLVSTFHHFQATLLTGDHLINAIRTFFIRDERQNDFKGNKKESLKGKK